LLHKLKEELELDFLYELTRPYYGESVFEKVFTRILQMCVDMGIVVGHTQVIDLAPVKANASKDSLELKVPEQDVSSHLSQVHQSNDDVVLSDE